MEKAVVKKFLLVLINCLQFPLLFNVASIAVNFLLLCKIVKYLLYALTSFLVWLGVIL